MAKTRAHQNRAIRQDAIRAQLAAGGHIQHVVDISNKLQELGNKLEPIDVTRLKAAADLKLKLIDKYVPSLQSIDSKIETVGDKRMKEMTDDELDAAILAVREESEAERSDKVH